MQAKCEGFCFFFSVEDTCGGSVLVAKWMEYPPSLSFPFSGGFPLVYIYIYIIHLDDLEKSFPKKPGFQKEPQPRRC